MERKIIDRSPFETIDKPGVGWLVRLGRVGRARGAPGTEARHLRRTRGGPGIDRVLPSGGAGLRLLLALSRSDRPHRGGASRHRAPARRLGLSEARLAGTRWPAMGHAPAPPRRAGADDDPGRAAVRSGVRVRHHAGLASADRRSELSQRGPRGAAVLRHLVGLDLHHLDGQLVRSGYEPRAPGRGRLRTLASLLMAAAVPGAFTAHPVLFAGRLRRASGRPQHGRRSAARARPRAATGAGATCRLERAVRVCCGWPAPSRRARARLAIWGRSAARRPDRAARRLPDAGARAVAHPRLPGGGRPLRRAFPVVSDHRARRVDHRHRRDRRAPVAWTPCRCWHWRWRF